MYATPVYIIYIYDVYVRVIQKSDEGCKRSNNNLAAEAPNATPCG